MPFNECEQVRKEIKKQTSAGPIPHLNEWKHYLGQFLCLLQPVFCFSFLSAFLSSKAIFKYKMPYKINDHNFNIFFVEIQLKKENLRNGHPKKGTANTFINNQFNEQKYSL